MGNIIIQDIVYQIGQHLCISQILHASRINKLINQHIKKIIWTHDIADLRFFDNSILRNILHTYNFTQIDLSNTMITDTFDGDLSNITNLIVKNCICLTDEFVKKIPKCTSLDLTNCANVTGSFVTDRPNWSKLKLSGCFFLDVNNLIRLNQCTELDLTMTIIMQESIGDNLSTEQKEKFISMLRRCETVVSNDYPISERMVQHRVNMSNVIYNYEHMMPPSMIHICNNFESDIRTSKILTRLYIHQRYHSYVKSLQKINEDGRGRRSTLFSKYPEITTGLMTAISAALTKNILNNSIFFRKSYDIFENDLSITKDKNITKIDDFYYDNNLLNDMIKNNYMPSMHIVDNKSILARIPTCDYQPHIDNKSILACTLMYGDCLPCENTRCLPYKLLSDNASILGGISTDNLTESDITLINTNHTKKIPIKKFNVCLDMYKKIRNNDQNNIQIKMKTTEFDIGQKKVAPMPLNEFDAEIQNYLCDTKIMIKKPTNPPDPKVLKGIKIPEIPIDEFNQKLKSLIRQRNDIHDENNVDMLRKKYIEDYNNNNRGIDY